MRAGIDNPAVVQALNARFIEFENSLEDMYRSGGLLEYSIFVLENLIGLPTRGATAPEE